MIGNPDFLLASGAMRQFQGSLIPLTGKHTAARPILKEFFQ